MTRNNSSTEDPSTVRAGDKFSWRTFHFQPSGGSDSRFRHYTVTMSGRPGSIYKLLFPNCSATPYQGQYLLLSYIFRLFIARYILQVGSFSLIQSPKLTCLPPSLSPTLPVFHIFLVTHLWSILFLGEYFSLFSLGGGCKKNVPKLPAKCSMVP